VGRVLTGIFVRQAGAVRVLTSAVGTDNDEEIVRASVDDSCRHDRNWCAGAHDSTAMRRVGMELEDATVLIAPRTSQRSISREVAPPT